MGNKPEVATTIQTLEQIGAIALELGELDPYHRLLVLIMQNNEMRLLEQIAAHYPNAPDPVNSFFSELSSAILKHGQRESAS